MKKLMLAFVLLTTSTFADEYKWAQDELLDLQENYTIYISSILKASKNIKQIQKLDCDLSLKQPAVSNVMLTGNKVFKLYPLEFFTRVNTLGAYNPTNMSVQDKKYLAEIDRAKVKVSLFMLTNLNTLYAQLAKKPTNTTSYKEFFKKSELHLLSLAKKALTSPIEEAEILSTEFNLVIQQLSAIPFPPEYSFYRRRMMYSLDTPQAAQQEITRINQSLANIK